MALQATGDSVVFLPCMEPLSCHPRLSAGVAMTSNVKSCQQIFLGLHDVFCPQCIVKAGASKKRRLILLLSVGWLPPYLHPSGACLYLGTSILVAAS